VVGFFIASQIFCSPIKLF